MNISKHKLRSVSLKDTLKTYRDFQKLERTGPRLLSPRTPRNRAAYVKNQFPDTEGQAAQDHDPRGKGDKRGEPWGCPPPCPEAGPTQRARGRDRGGTVPSPSGADQGRSSRKVQERAQGMPPLPLEGGDPSWQKREQRRGRGGSGRRWAVRGPQRSPAKGAA